MSDRILERKSRCAMVGAVMTIIGLLFLFYIVSSLVHSTKKYLEETEVEMVCK